MIQTLSSGRMKADISAYVKPWVKDVPSLDAEQKVKGLVRLGSNENNSGPSFQAVRPMLDTARFAYVYPHQQGLVREKIAGILEVGVGSVMIGGGCFDVLDAILKVFRGPVASVYPTRREYEVCARALGEEYVRVNLKGDFTFPVEDFIAKSAGANVLILANPNDPTGGVIPEDAIKRILDEGKITVVDESYYEFYGKTVLPLLPEYNNLIVVQTLSHAFALAGLRLAYAVADAEVAALLNKVKPPVNVTSLTLEAALGALHDDEYMISKVKEIRRDREMLHKGLSARFKPLKSHASFILVDVSPMTSKQFCERARYFGFDVRDIGRLDGFSGEYVRISVGTWEDVNKFVHVLDKI